MAGAPLVAVVNETFARRFWPGQSAIGRTFLAFGMAPAGSEQAVTEKRMFEVVGVTKDGKYLDFDDEAIPYYWTSIYQDYAARVVVAAKGTLSAEAMVSVLTPRQAKLGWTLMKLPLDGNVGVDMPVPMPVSTWTEYGPADRTLPARS